MEQVQLLSNFFASISDDARVTAYHISVYAALLFYWQAHGGGEKAFSLFSRDLLPFAKLSRPGTYHRIMKDLADFGYIQYVPSHSPVLGSLVQLIKMDVL